jgi:geranylgeranyl diphosphate synthase type II
MAAACAVEMVHTYSLIHDDLPAMDDDDLRRGRPSCHKAFGEAMAILAGDALLTLAFRILAAEVQPPEVATRCCGELAAAAGASGMVAGQAEDLQAERLGNRDAARLEKIHRLKTGAMLRASLRLGGLVADAEPQQISALDRYGENVGLAFQVVDDLLDLEGDEAQIGKRTGQDSRRGKLTFPEVLGAAASRNRAAQLVAEACQAISLLGHRAAGLQAMARFVLERKR